MIVSVIHSGTHFVRRLLGGDVVWQHVYPTTPIDAVLTWDSKFTVPLRDPAACMLSHLQHCVRPAAKPGYFEGVAECWRKVVSLPAVFVPIELTGPPLNPSPETPEKRLYRSGDMDAFRATCPQIWSALQGMRDVLPVFKANGYADFAWE